MSTGSLSAFSHPGCCSRTEADLHCRSGGCRAPLPRPATGKMDCFAVQCRHQQLYSAVPASAGPPLHLRGAKRRKLTQALSSLAGRPLCHSSLHGQSQPSRATICCAAAAAAKGPVVVIDNYDSFTYNLCQVGVCWSQQQAANFQIGSLPGQHLPCSPVKCPLCVLLQYLGNLGCNHIVLKNDEKTVEEIRAMNPLGVLVSPGPGMVSIS